MPQNSNPKKLMDQIFIHPRNSVSETIFFICHGLDEDSRKYYDAVVFRCYNLFLYSKEFCVFQWGNGKKSDLSDFVDFTRSGPRPNFSSFTLYLTNNENSDFSRQVDNLEEKRLEKSLRSATFRLLPYSK